MKECDIFQDEVKELGNVLAVGNCCYVAVCSAALGASAPWRTLLGGGQNPSYIFSGGWGQVPPTSPGSTPLYVSVVLDHRVRVVSDS